MIRGIVDWSLQYRLLIIVATAVLVFFGIGRAASVPVDIYPEFAPVSVEVRSEALGLSAQEVSELITAPLEADLLTNVPWVDIIRSESVPGLSSVELIFEPGTDLLRARQVVQERVAEAAVALPGASRPPEMLQPSSSNARVMMIGISSPSLSLIDLSVLARWNMRPRLLGVEGVSNVAIWGLREQQLQVQVDPAKLQAQRVPLLQMIEATANALWASPLSFVEAAVPGTGGWIDTPNQRIGVQHVSPITRPEDLAQIALEERPALHIGDLARVVEDHQPLIGDAVLKDGPGLILVIEKWPEASATEVTKGIENALKAMAPGLAGVTVEPNLYRPASYVEESVDNVIAVALIAGVLILVALAALLFDWRTALVGLVTIPLSFLASVLVLELLGESLNLVVLAGLAAALVLLIDDAVISGVALWRRRSQTREADFSAAAVVGEAIAGAHGPLVFATLITLVLLLPLFFLNGFSGAFFPPAALAYAVAIVSSAVVAAVVAPALAILVFPSKALERSPSGLPSRLQNAYEQALARLIARPALAFVVAGVAVIVGVGLTSQLSQPSLLPSLKERNVLIEWDGAPGTSRAEMTRIVTQAAGEIKAVPGVANVGAHVGRAITSDLVVGINSGEIWVTIGEDADYDKTVAALQDVVNGYAGLDRAVITYPEKRVQEVLAGTSRDVVVRVYGDDYAVLKRQAEVVQESLASIKGVVDPAIELPIEEPTLEIQVDLAAAQRFGIKPGDVRRSAATLLSGLLVGNLFEEQKVFEVVVWSTPETRDSVSAVENLLIDTPTGSFVRLSEVASVRVTPNVAQIKREAVSRYLDVSADVDGRGVSDVEDEINERVRGLGFPIDYHAEVATDRASGFRESRASVVPYIAAAVIGAFLLLQAAFSSWRLAAIAFIVLPAALVGGVVAAVIDGGDISLGSYMGFVAVLAISIRNGVSLVQSYQVPERAGDGSFDAAAAIAGAGRRFLPVLITTIAAALAMLPLVIAGSVPGLEVVRPMAVVILGGLVTSTLLALFLLPALFLSIWRPSEQEVAL